MMLRSSLRAIQRPIASAPALRRSVANASFSTSAIRSLRAVNAPTPPAAKSSSSPPSAGTSSKPKSTAFNSAKPRTTTSPPARQAPIAERPPSVPPSITNPSTAPKRFGEAGIGFEPVVNVIGGEVGAGKVNGAEAEEPVLDKAEEKGSKVDPIDQTSSAGADTRGGPAVAAEQEETFVVPDQPDFSKLPSLDIDPSLRSDPTESAEGEGKERGAIPPPASSSTADPSSSSSSPSSSTQTKAAPRSLSSIERQRRNLLRLSLLGFTVVAAYGVYELATKEDSRAVAQMQAERARSLSTNPTTAELEASAFDTSTSKPQGLEGYYLRFKANFSDLLDHFNKPAFEKLLPDPLPPTHQRPYTLLVDLEDMLVKSTWDRQSGWRTAKRPGVDYFLAYLSQFYEIVLFTTQPSFVAMGIADKLDPFQAYLPYKLYRESSRYVKGKIVKDLTYLNRDLSKVILLDTNPEHAAAQPENSIILPKWDGTAGDKGLVDYIPFLESIGIFNPPDVRPILKAYAGQNIPVEYAKKEAERKQAAIEEWERDHGSIAGSGGAVAGWLRSALGGLGGNPVARPTQPTTYLESKRAQAQQMYKEEQEYWRKNADEIKRLMDEDMQKQLAASKGTLMGWMGGAKPAPAS